MKKNTGNDCVEKRIFAAPKKAHNCIKGSILWSTYNELICCNECDCKVAPDNPLFTTPLHCETGFCFYIYLINAGKLLP